MPTINAGSISQYIDKKQNKINSTDQRLLKKYDAFLLVWDGMSVMPAVQKIDIEYNKQYKDKLSNLALYLDDIFGQTTFDEQKSKIQVGSITLNFEVKKSVTESSGTVIKTEIQEKGTTVILNQVLRHNKKFTKPADIMNDNSGANNTADKLREVFKGYDDDKIEEWTYSYYEQQREFLTKFQGPKWDVFTYDNQSFVKFFEKHIKDKVIARNLKPLDLVKKYTEWNPSDIWAVYEMGKVKDEIDENITPKTSNVLELNNLLINLFNQNKLIGLNYPSYADITTSDGTTKVGQRMVPPMIKLTVGDYISDQPGYFENINIFILF